MFEMAQMVDLIEKQRWSPTHNLAHPINLSKVSREEPSFNEQRPPRPVLGARSSQALNEQRPLHTCAGSSGPRPLDEHQQPRATNTLRGPWVTPLPSNPWPPSWQPPTHCASPVTSRLDEPTVNPAGGRFYTQSQGEHCRCSQKGHFFIWTMLTSDSLAKLWNTKKPEQNRKGFCLQYSKTFRSDQLSRYCG